MYAVLFWLVTAAIVASANASHHGWLGFAAILAAAYVYSRMCSRGRGVPHALSVGITWLVLTVVVEMWMAARGMPLHDALLGAADQPFLHNLSLFAWVFSPALFAQRACAEPAA